MAESSMRIACLVSRRRGIVVLGHEDGKEERAESALFGARQVELSVGFTLSDVAAVIEHAVHGVNVAIEDERPCVQRTRALDTAAVRACASAGRAAPDITKPQAAGI